MVFINYGAKYHPNILWPVHLNFSCYVFKNFFSYFYDYDLFIGTNCTTVPGGCVKVFAVMFCSFII